MIEYCVECCQGHLSTISGGLDEGYRLGLKDKDLTLAYERMPKILEHIKELEEWDLRPEVLETVQPYTREYLERLKANIRELRKSLADTKLSLGGGTWEDFEKALSKGREIRDEFYEKAPIILSIEGQCPTCRVASEILSGVAAKPQSHISADRLPHSGGHIKSPNR